MHDKHYVADVVINHELDDITLFSVEPYTRMCLGLEWALLRKAFLEAAKKGACGQQRSEIKNIVVAFGGIDQYCLTSKVISMLVLNEGIEKIDAIVGEKYQGTTDTIFSDKTQICFHQSIPSQEVANLFSNCDLAVLSASIVYLEALACGAKVAAGYYVDNQIEGYNNLKNKCFIYGLGALLDLKSLDVYSMDFSDIKTPKIQNVAESYIQCFKTII
jgi:spore coat polysaccharide biosynthesis predicted glycosyltransferase SpsG